MQILKMDFQSQSTPPVVPVMQSDAQSRFIGIALYDGGAPYAAPENAAYTVQYHGPGPNNMGWYDTISTGNNTHPAVTVDASNKHIVTLELAEQALRVNGNVFINLCVVTSTGYMLHTFPILCRVTGAAYIDPVAVRSFFYVTGITNDQWLAYVTACQDAQNRAEAAAATFQTDPTLSLPGKAADAKATGDAIGQLKEDIADAEKRITSKMTLIEPINLWGMNNITDGYVDLNGNTHELTELCYMPLDVYSGDILRLLNWTESQNKYNTYSMRFITTYDVDGKAVASSGSENANNFVIPDGITKVIITISKKIVYPCLMINPVSNPKEPIEFFIPYYVADDGFIDKDTIIEKAIDKIMDKVNNSFIKLSPSCILENGLLWNTDSDRMVVTFTLGSTSDALFVCANASGIGRLYYVNYKTGKIGTVKSDDITVIPTAWGYFEDITIPAVIGRMYALTIEKKNGTTFTMILKDLSSLETQKFTNTNDQGSGNGVRTVITSGSPIINNFITFSTQNANPYIMFIGDSFIEGNQLTTKNKDSRYCALVRDTIAVNGHDTFIYGLAGRNSTDISTAYYEQVKGICRPKYAFLEIGTNDRNYDTWLSNMTALIRDLKNNGIIPILCTLTPIIGNPESYNDNVMPNVNEWIKKSGYKYVDFNAVLTSDGVTQISSYFLSDGCHPNIDGNAVMFEKIKVDVPELFS